MSLTEKQKEMNNAFGLMLVALLLMAYITLDLTGDKLLAILVSSGFYVLLVVGHHRTYKPFMKREEEPEW